MPAHSQEFVLELHETNARLSGWLDTLTPSTDHPNLPPRAATPQQMAGLLSELMRAGERLRALPAARHAGLEGELSAYRANVERLRTLLPLIQSTLLNERARLEQERVRVTSAVEWARRSRQTL